MPHSDFILAFASMSCGIAIGSGLRREEWWVRVMLALYAMLGGVLMAVAWSR